MVILKLNTSNFWYLISDNYLIFVLENGGKDFSDIPSARESFGLGLSTFHFFDIPLVLYLQLHLLYLDPDVIILIC
jgi:hypothetical protein